MKIQSPILRMDKDQLLAINPDDVDWELSEAVILHFFRKLGGCLEFDYRTLDGGNPDDHYKLKAKQSEPELCSNVFLTSKAVLQHENIRKILAKQLANKVRSVIKGINLTCVGGIPKGATLLGEDVAKILSVENTKFSKEDGKIRIRPSSLLGSSDMLLLVEDIFKKGTALEETVDIASRGSSNSGKILPFVFTIINRGELSQVRIGPGVFFEVISLCSIKTNVWKKSDCELCSKGSKRIKP